MTKKLNFIKDGQNKSKRSCYGEFQTSVPVFAKEIWEQVNSQLKGIKVLIRKIWLSGKEQIPLVVFTMLIQKKMQENLRQGATHSRQSISYKFNG
jgi:hypothetical protein